MKKIKNVIKAILQPAKYVYFHINEDFTLSSDLKQQMNVILYFGYMCVCRGPVGEACSKNARPLSFTEDILSTSDIQ